MYGTRSSAAPKKKEKHGLRPSQRRREGDKTPSAMGKSNNIRYNLHALLKSQTLP
ncbi:MAG: hypothetical protein JWR59_2455 [Brevundimonas sp.]|nr:hypothetical protein [Brevundimonas sp.]